MTALQRIRQFRLLYVWLPPVVWMGLIFFLSAQPDFPQTETLWIDTLISIGAHAFLFAMLAVLWARAVGDRPWGWLIALALTLLYALTDEFHQSFVPGRCMDPWDLLWDGLGAAMGLGLWLLWQRDRHEEQGDG